MTITNQHRTGLVIAIAGVAGSGKTTLGRQLARRLRLPLLDLDSITTPLLEAVPLAGGGQHWLISEHGPQIREGRYASLRTTARDVVETAGSAVLVAPFTRELQGGEDWETLRRIVEPAELTMVQLVGSVDLFATRRTKRGEERDRQRPSDLAPAPPRIPVVAIDAELTTAQQITQIQHRLGMRRPVDPHSAVLSRTFEAVLFDLDGTLVDSRASVLRSWRKLAEEFDVPLDEPQRNHKQPPKALLEKLLPSDRIATALSRINQLEVDDAGTVRSIAGSPEFLAAIPEQRRAIITSRSVPIATRRLAAAGIPCPEVLLTAADIEHPQPNPKPFLEAARRLGTAPKRCLVIEDTPAGIASAAVAGCSVIALTGTTEPADLAGAELVLDSLDALRVQVDRNGVRVANAD